MNNEGNMEHAFVEDLTLEQQDVRNHVQKAVLLASLHRTNNEDFSNPEAHEWFDAHANNFRRAFNAVLEVHPTFWGDIVNNFDGAVELVKQKLAEIEEKIHA